MGWGCKVCTGSLGLYFSWPFVFCFHRPVSPVTRGRGKKGTKDTKGKEGQEKQEEKKKTKAHKSSRENGMRREKRMEKRMRMEGMLAMCPLLLLYWICLASLSCDWIWQRHLRRGKNKIRERQKVRVCPVCVSWSSLRINTDRCSSLLCCWLVVTPAVRQLTRRRRRRMTTTTMVMMMKKRRRMQLYPVSSEWFLLFHREHFWPHTCTMWGQKIAHFVFVISSHSCKAHLALK